MLKVGMMDPRSQLITKGKIVTGNYSQSPQSKDQVSGFLMDVLTRLIEFSNQGSTEGQGESVDLNRSTKGSKDSNLDDTGTQDDLTDNKVSIYPSVSLALGKSDPSGVFKIGIGANQEKKPAQEGDRCPLESIFSGKGVVLGGPLNKEEDTKLTQVNPVLTNRDQKLVLSLNQSPVDGTYVTAQETEEVKSDLINPNKQTAASELILKESSNKEEGIINGTDFTVRLNRGEPPVLSSAQSIVDEIPIQAQESKDTKSGFINSNKQAAASGLILEETSNKEEGIINGTGYTLRLNRGEQPVFSSARFLMDGIPDQAHELEEAESGSMNPNKQTPIERLTLKESLEIIKHLNFTVEDYLPENILKSFATKVAQTLFNGTSGSTLESEKKKFGFKNLVEQGSDKVLVKTEGLPSGIIKVQDAEEKQSFASMAIEKTEEQTSEKGNEKQEGLDSLFKNESFNNEKNLISTKNQEGLGKALEREEVNDKGLPQPGDFHQGKKSSQVQISQIDLAGGAFRDSSGKGKIIDDKLNRFDQPQRSFELDFLKDNYFIVKKQSSSSMEIVLEPAGLGKLDIELNLTNDRLYGQIMVNDYVGKGLIEKNLPQLMSDLVNEGLQIGGFTVSLKNQGRDQNPDQIPSEARERPRTALNPETIPMRKDDHLIHIII